MSIVFLLVTAVITYFAVQGVLYFFPRWGLLDNPQKYGHKRNAIAYPAGVIIPLVFFTICFFILPEESIWQKPFIGFFFASMLLLVSSFIDDRKGLPALFRLSIQVIVAGIIIASGIGIDEIRAPFGLNISLDTYQWDILGHQFVLFADFLAIIWIIAMINAMNWLDGISGLTSSVSAISATVLAIVAYFFQQSDMAMVFAVFAVICFVVLIFDLYPAKILMGDSGSMFLGLALAVFTIIAGGKIATALIVMFVPLFDAVWTIGRRIYYKQSPFKGDVCHLHHKLLSLFKSSRKVVLFYAGSTAFFGFFSIFLETQGKVVLLIFLCMFLLLLEIYLEKRMKK
jgi:UDP-GlcNAc:undecaprenyl-phosphate/decaprenyl-phosphate GlcNAc-1-phosphate transferase